MYDFRFDDLTPCAGGPLDGERHDLGPEFQFEGQSVGLPSGRYVLVDEVYHWQPADESNS